MLKYMKYFAALNLLSFIDEQLIGGVFAGDNNGADTNGPSDDDRGFGRQYKWRNLEQGFDEARKLGQPIFLVVHRSTCPACQTLKAKFSKSMQLIDLSKQFVMVNAENDVLKDDKKFQPDGGYVPRILFYAPDGKFISEAYNHNSQHEKFRYFYSSPSDIAEIMRFVLKKFPGAT